MEAARRAPQAAATEGLYERHSAKILGYCLHQLGSREEAEDAVQTTFMNAFRALGRGVVPEAEVAWLFKIAENVCLSRRRSSWRRGRIESPSDFDVIEEIVPGPNRQRDELIGIEDALANMPEQQRRAILLREWQGLSYREIADELEVSQSAVETLIFRARRSLAQGLERPDTLKPKRKSFRRALHVIDAGTAFAAIKTFLAGSAAVKATAAAIAVTAAAGTAAGVESKLEGKRHGSVEAQPAAVVAPAAAKPAALAVAAAYAPAAAASAPTSVEAAAAPTSVVNGSKRPPQKIAEKATAKPPVHEQPAPVAAVPARIPAPAAGPAPAPAQPAEQRRAAEPTAKEQPKAKAKDDAKPEPARAAQPVREEKKAEQEQKANGNSGKGKAKGEEPAPAPPPAAVVAPVEVVAAVEAEAKKARGKGNDKHQPVTDPAPQPTATVETAATPVAATAVVDPAVAAADASKRKDK